MKEIRHDTTASPTQIWQVLSNGWLFASWVVGASRIRGVEGDWPSVGAKIHHSVGSWPLLLNDETLVTRSEPKLNIALLARTRPFGESSVEIELAPSGAGTTIMMREDFTTGPLRILPVTVRQAALIPRNRESLRRLAFLAEGDAR